MLLPSSFAKAILKEANPSLLICLPKYRPPLPRQNLFSLTRFSPKETLQAMSSSPLEPARFPLRNIQPQLFLKYKHPPILLPRILVSQVYALVFNHTPSFSALQKLVNHLKLGLYQRLPPCALQSVAPCVARGNNLKEVRAMPPREAILCFFRREKSALRQRQLLQNPRSGAHFGRRVPGATLSVPWSI